MGEWQDLGEALGAGAPVSILEAYRIFMAATQEEQELFGGAAQAMSEFSRLNYETYLPRGIYESWWSSLRIRTIDPELPRYNPIEAATEHIPHTNFMRVDLSYIAQVYAAYNRLRHYQVAGGTPGGMYLRSYRCLKQFSSPPASVWDAYLTCWDELAPEGGGTYRAYTAGVGFKFSHREASGSVTEAWTGLLDVCVPSFRLAEPSSGAVFSREAFLCPATMGIYDMNWRYDSHEYLNFAAPGGCAVGDSFEFIPDVLGETADGKRTYITGSYRLPDLPEALLRAADPHAGGGWGYALHNGWEYENGFILRREYTDRNQYLNLE